MSTGKLLKSIRDVEKIKYDTELKKLAHNRTMDRLSQDIDALRGQISANIEGLGILEQNTDQFLQRYRDVFGEEMAKIMQEVNEFTDDMPVMTQSGGGVVVGRTDTLVKVKMHHGLIHKVSLRSLTPEKKFGEPDRVRFARSMETGSRLAALLESKESMQNFMEENFEDALAMPVFAECVQHLHDTCSQTEDWQTQLRERSKERMKKDKSLKRKLHAPLLDAFTGIVNKNDPEKERYKEVARQVWKDCFEDTEMLLANEFRQRR